MIKMNDKIINKVANGARATAAVGAKSARMLLEQHTGTLATAEMLAGSDDSEDLTEVPTAPLPSESLAAATL